MAHLATSSNPHFFSPAPPSAFLHPTASSCWVATREVKSRCHPVPSHHRRILLRDQQLLNRRHLGIRYERKNNEDEDVDVVITVVDRFASILAKPTPGIPDLALGYPLTLLGAAAILPTTTSVLLALFFGFFSYFGRRFIADDVDDEEEEGEDRPNYDFFFEEEDRPKIDFLALGAAVASAGILSTGDNVDVGRFPTLGVLVAALALGAVAIALPSDAHGTREESPDQSMMNLWDEQLEKENKKKKNSR
jgi:hypothetical protein